MSVDRGNAGLATESEPEGRSWSYFSDLPVSTTAGLPSSNAQSINRSQALCSHLSFKSVDCIGWAVRVSRPRDQPYRPLA